MSDADGEGKQTAPPGPSGAVFGAMAPFGAALAVGVPLFLGYKGIMWWLDPGGFVPLLLLIVVAVPTAYAFIHADRVTSYD